LSIKIISDNRRGYYDYFILEKYEAGVVLKGSEVKSLREGRVSLKDSYVSVSGDEVYLYNCHINPYSHDSSRSDYDPLRKRKLLLNKREIDDIAGEIAEKGLAVIPLKLYFKKGKAKLEIAIAKGKKLYDKREAIKKRDSMREAEKIIKERR